MNVNEEIQSLLDMADLIAEAHIEKLARKILKEHTNLDEFIMAMGDCFFYR